MKANSFIKAKAQNGLVAVSVPFNGFGMVLLGASCFSTVSRADGIVDTLIIVPKRAQEVVALAAIRQLSDKNIVAGAWLISVTLAEGKANIDIESPYVPDPDHIGQIVHTENTCTMRLNQGDKKSESTVKLFGDGADAGKTFNTECQFLVTSGARLVDQPQEEVIRVVATEPVAS